jgi:hypothetical protein
MREYYYKTAWVVYFVVGVEKSVGSTPGVVHMAKPTLLPEKAYGTSNYFV